MVTHAAWYSCDLLPEEEHALPWWPVSGFPMAPGELEVTAAADPKHLSHITHALRAKESRVLGTGGSVLLFNLSCLWLQQF